MGSIPFGSFKELKGFSGGGGGAVSPSSLVLDSDDGRLVAGPARLGKMGGSDTRAAMALKSHSEAERRRRERINTHLDALRSMVPCTNKKPNWFQAITRRRDTYWNFQKLDKAGLLAEVMCHVKELKSQAAGISKTCIVPSVVDEVSVEVDGSGMNNENFLVKATLSCDDRPELCADLRQTFHALQLKIVGAEISSLGSRVKHVLMLSWEGNPDDYERNLFITSIHQALKSVLDRAAEPDFLHRTSFSSKRQRTSLFESSSSST